MLKRFFYTALLSIASLIAIGQQDALLDFESFGDIYNNPAHIINSDVWLATVNYNNMLPGFEDGPKSYYLSFGGPMSNRKMDPSLRYMQGIRNKSREPKYGLGGYILSDSYGYYSYNSFMLNYAQRFKLGNAEYLSFGVGIGIYNSHIDEDKLRVEVEADPAYLDRLNFDGRFTMGDVNFGAIFHSEYLQLGFAARHLLNNKLKLGETPDFAQLNETFTFFGKGRVMIADDVEMIPSVMGSFTKSLPWDVKISAPFVIQEMFLAGLAWTPTRSIAVETGLYYKNVFFGYSFGINTSKISTISNLGHQIGIRYVLPIWSQHSTSYTINKDLF